VPGHPAVRVDDDLAAGQPGVPHRATDLEPPGRVDQQPVVLGVQVDAQPGQHGLNDVLAHVRGQQPVQVDGRRVLGRDHHRVQPHRPDAVVLDGDLGLAVRAQVGDGAVAAGLRHLPGQPVRQHDRQRHQLGGLPAGVAEHHALIASALAVQLVGALAGPVLKGVADALGNIRRLGTDGNRYPAGSPVESLG
jgi:hypothetical protein